MFYDPNGRCLGYTNGKHWCFDPMGAFIESKRPKENTESSDGDEKSEKGEKKGIIESLKEAFQ